mmetsp:Transcript_914/g.1536  ORF Transcript_914/g.1536 Transcript_914/m.1536 type:complete len:156 (+) Transcript_914:94-561(+)|eukprot:CAMPEP_0119312100 /NCGR_PEP_ID=MMETSP1333-20130426/25037_1 /TAXON_ID=418940 /ORGANISM="Scyphosphaera apsteinii, Strain RCC1455" /LENGTH=155 /DNA_ID=CAMNT_0007316657 /DNA_START=29 /DNA_END=496 /DNA_ORIENTATION=+
MIQAEPLSEVEYPPTGLPEGFDVEGAKQRWAENRELQAEQDKQRMKAATVREAEDKKDKKATLKPGVFIPYGLRDQLIEQGYEIVPGPRGDGPIIDGFLGGPGFVPGLGFAKDFPEKAAELGIPLECPEGWIPENYKPLPENWLEMRRAVDKCTA